MGYSEGTALVSVGYEVGRIVGSPVGLSEGATVLDGRSVGWRVGSIVEVGLLLGSRESA